MATFRTPSRSDAARFIRSLVERGFTRRPSTGHGGNPARDTFTVTYHHERIVISYFEPSEPICRRPVPEALARSRQPRVGQCATEDCERAVYTRGLCNTCYQRWRYQNQPGARERKLERETQRARKGREAA